MRAMIPVGITKQDKMAPKKAINGASKIEYLCAYLQHCNPGSKLQPADIQALGVIFDLRDKKNAESAAGTEDPSTPGGGGAAAKKKTPAGGRKKKTGATATPANFEDGEDAEAEPSPAKKRKIEEEV
ncbi:hypothetical protein PG984_011072 [Apiospora sp. TS-2023a]